MPLTRCETCAPVTPWGYTRKVCPHRKHLYRRALTSGYTLSRMFFRTSWNRKKRLLWMCLAIWISGAIGVAPEISLYPQFTKVGTVTDKMNDRIRYLGGGA